MKKTPELILLIDDDEDDNFIHKRAIKKSGLECQIDVCTSGDMALDYLTNQGNHASRGTDYPRPDLIFLDINMPRVDGWEFLDQYAQWIDKNRQEAATIIVMLSNSIDPRDINRASANRFVQKYTTKPLKPDEIVDIVSTYFSPVFET